MTVICVPQEVTKTLQQVISPLNHLRNEHLKFCNFCR